MPDAAFSDVRLRTAWSMVSTEGVDVLSLDVFDTLLWRAVPVPTDAFYLLGQRLERAGLMPADISPAGFSRLRVAAEEQARERAKERRNSTECRLAEIYEVLGAALPGADAHELIAHEIAVERDLCRPDLGVADLARLTGKLGKRVVLVSDTYFSADHLATLLDQPGIGDLPISKIFTSSDMGVGKTDGLIDRALHAIGADPRRTVHVGDNEAADVRAAKRAEATGLLYSKLTPDLKTIIRREGMLPAGATLDAVQGDYGIEALRARAGHRAESEDIPEPLRPYWTSGATVFGPAFTGFAEWVDKRASELGVDRVFCLMREGEFLGELINQARPGAIGSVRAEVIWMSRQVAACAAMLASDRASLERVLVRRTQPTPRELATQLGFPLEMLPELADIAGTRLFTQELIDRVFEAIERNGPVRARIVQHAAAVRERVLRYLDERLPRDAKRVVIVDIGWRGTIQGMLADLLKAVGRDVELVGLYLITNQGAVEQRLRGVRVEGYLGDLGEPAGLLAPIIRSPEIIEQICMSDVGSLVSLADDLSAVTADVRMPRAQVAQKSAVQQGILAFQREWLRNAEANDGIGALTEPVPRQLVLRSVARFLSRPTRDEALLFGAWSHDDNFGSEAHERLAGAGSLEEIRYLSPLQLHQMTMADLYWPTGVAAVADEGLATELALAGDGLVDPEQVSPPASSGAFEIFPDEGEGFRADAKLECVPRLTQSGLASVRWAVQVRRLRGLRIDLGTNRGLIRVDWLELRLHGVGVDAPELRRYTSLRGEPLLTVQGAVLLQSNLIEITTNDPQILWRPDGVMFDRACRVEVSLAFAWMEVRPEPIAPAPPPTHHAPLVRRARRVAGRTIRAMRRPG